MCKSDLDSYSSTSVSTDGLIVGAVDAKKEVVLLHNTLSNKIMTLKLPFDVDATSINLNINFT